MKRGITSAGDLERRLESAEAEVARRHEFKHIIVNDDLDRAYGEICTIIKGL